MPAAITITGVKRDGGKLYVQFSDNSEYEYEGRRDARRANRAILQDAEAIEFLKAMLICKGLRRLSDASDDLDALVGRTVTLDLSVAANLVRIT